jgi:hypothetical protein
MNKNYYSLEGKGITERKKLFETDPKTYIYSVMHEIIDRSFALVEAHEDELNVDFYEALPFEVLTQLLNFMSGVFDLNEIFDHIETMEQLLQEQLLLRKIQ